MVGSHYNYKHPVKPGKVTVPFHGKKELPKSVVSSVFETSGDKEMKTYIYPASFYKDERGGYAVGFCDFELATCVETLEEAFVMAEEALTARVFLMLRDGEELPLPSAISDVTKPEDAEFTALIKTDAKYLGQEKSVRKNVTLPAYLAEAAEKADINFSKVLRDALKEKLSLG